MYLSVYEFCKSGDPNSTCVANTAAAGLPQPLTRDHIAPSVSKSREGNFWTDPLAEFPVALCPLTGYVMGAILNLEELQGSA